MIDYGLQFIIMNDDDDHHSLSLIEDTTTIITYLPKADLFDVNFFNEPNIRLLRLERSWGHDATCLMPSYPWPNN